MSFKGLKRKVAVYLLLILAERALGRMLHPRPAAKK